jgi:hypothetical protein
MKDHAVSIFWHRLDQTWFCDPDMCVEAVVLWCWFLKLDSADSRSALVRRDQTGPPRNTALPS